MNSKEVALEEIELHRSLLDEGLSALLHSIIFIRAPCGVKPEDTRCKLLEPLVYARCGSDVNSSVSDGIKLLAATASPIGPHLSRGTVSLSFYEQREARGLFGLVRNAEKVVFERWHLPVIISDADLGGGKDGLGSIGVTREAIRRRIVAIVDTANQSIDHVPASMYEYDIEVAAHGSEKQRHVLHKLISNSYSMNLG